MLTFCSELWKWGPFYLKTVLKDILWFTLICFRDRFYFKYNGSHCMDFFKIKKTSNSLSYILKIKIKWKNYFLTISTKISKILWLFQLCSFYVIQGKFCFFSLTTTIPYNYFLSVNMVTHNWQHIICLITILLTS